MLKKIVRRLFSLGRPIESIVGDLWMNVNTRGFERNDQRGCYQDAFDYDTATHIAIKRVIRLVQPTEYDIVFDLGCGKGRVLCHFARQHVHKVVGVEISEQICETARTNICKLHNRRSPVEIIRADAATADISDGTIYYMYNPFGAETLRAFLNNIQRSYKHEIEALRIIYMNAQFAHVFDEFPWLEIAFDYKRINGQRVIIYRGSVPSIPMVKNVPKS